MLSGTFLIQFWKWLMCSTWMSEKCRNRWAEPCLCGEADCSAAFTDLDMCKWEDGIQKKKKKKNLEIHGSRASFCPRLWLSVRERNEPSEKKSQWCVRAWMCQWLHQYGARYLDLPLPDSTIESVHTVQCDDTVTVLLHSTALCQVVCSFKGQAKTSVWSWF